MMFNRFKESLKPCSNNNLPPSYSQFSSFSQNPDSLNPRKPPKSNLSQQLQRLEDPISFPRYQPQYTQKQPPSLLRHEQCNKEEEEEEEEEKEEKDDIKQELSGTEKPRSDFLQFDHTGPFEPLALSPEGEVPLIQVPAAINCRLLEHQREGVKFLYHLYTNNHGGVLGDDIMLDILEKLLIRKGYCFSRLDGSTPTNLRQSLVDDFNSSPSKQVFLISTRAGGLGLNLVSANRVVIFDPNWNPAQDLQAQDRSFRFGQKRHVVVLRLLAAGSLEELVYSRQVYKQQLSNIAVSGTMENQYFEGVQDCKEFKGELFGICNLFRDLSIKLFTSEIIELHGKQDQGKPHSGAQDLTDLRNHFVPLEKTSQPSQRELEDGKPDIAERPITAKPKLEDLGILYAHRNEGIVNAGPYGNRNGDDNPPPTSRLSHLSLPVSRETKPAKAREGKNVAPPGDKKSRYSLLAQFMGMTEFEFSKWLLSASSSERERVLRDYKKRKLKKTPNG